MESFNTKTQDIEGLKQKLSVYKQTLETMKSGSVVEDYLLMKNECYSIIKQISKLDGDMKKVEDKQEVQITNYQAQVDCLTEEIGLIKKSLANLKQDVMYLSNKIDNFNVDEIVIKMENVIRNELHVASQKRQEKNELKVLKDEILELKKLIMEKDRVKQTLSKKVPQKSQPSSFQQLRSMINSSLHSEARITSHLDIKTGLKNHREVSPYEVGNVSIKRKASKEVSEQSHMHIENTEDKLSEPSEDDTKLSSPSGAEVIKDNINEYDSTTIDDDQENQNKQSQVSDQSQQPKNKNEVDKPEQSQPKQIFFDHSIEKIEDKPSFFSFFQRGKQGEK